MKIGDLVQFPDNGHWPPVLAGRIGLVTAVRSRGWGDFYFDAIVDGQLRLGFGYYRDRQEPDPTILVVNEVR